MEMTNRAKIALGLMVELASRSGGKPLVLASVANKLDTSVSHLESITARLRSKGLVAAARGPGGGYRLGRDVAEISVSEIVLAAESSSHLFEDVLTHRLEGGESDMLAQRLFEEVEREAISYLNQISLSSLTRTARNSEIPGLQSDQAQGYHGPYISSTQPEPWRVQPKPVSPGLSLPQNTY